MNLVGDLQLSNGACMEPFTKRGSLMQGSQTTTMMTTATTTTSETTPSSPLTGGSKSDPTGENPDGMYGRH